MSRLKSLLHVATPSTRNTQQNPVQVCKVVAQQIHTTQQAHSVLRDLVLDVMVLVGEPPADWQGYIDAALADPDDAMTCYASLKRELQQPTVETMPMVKAADLIYTLQLGGFEFSLIDDRLSIEPYEKLNIATKELINQNDSAIIAELRRIEQ